MTTSPEFDVEVCGRSFGDHLNAARSARYLKERTKKDILARAREQHEKRPGHQAAFGGPWPIQSKQVRKGGTREFYAEPWPSFWYRYQRMSPKQRTYNESIRHGQPCKLYFDIDAKQVQGGAEGIRACHQRVQAFLGWVGAQLAHRWPTLLSESKARGEPMMDVVWLDASSVAKQRFSVHLIINLVGNVLFESNTSLARFVDWLVDRARDEESEQACTATVLPARWVINAHKQPGDIIDRSVYHAGKAHEMRILDSHKMGEPERPLVPFDGVLLQPLTVPEGERERYFYRSLIGYVPPGATVAHLLHCRYETGRVDALGRSDGATASESSLHGIPIRHATKSLSNHHRVPAGGGAAGGGGGSGGGGNTTGGGSDAMQVDCKEEEEEEEGREDTPEQATCSSSATKKRKREAFSEQALERATAADPLTVTPEQEEAVALKLKALLPRLEANISDAMPGYPVLRFLHWSPELGCLTFASTNKICEVKRGPHSSNHVFYVLWLEKGIFYQRCFNRKCYALYCERLRELGITLTEEQSGPDRHHRTARGHAHVLDPSLWAEAHACVLYPRYNMDVPILPAAAKRARGEPATGGGGGDRGGGSSINNTLRRLPGMNALAPARDGEDDIDRLVRDALIRMNVNSELETLFDD